MIDIRKLSESDSAIRFLADNAISCMLLDTDNDTYFGKECEAKSPYIGHILFSEVPSKDTPYYVLPSRLRFGLKVGSSVKINIVEEMFDNFTYMKTKLFAQPLFCEMWEYGTFIVSLKT